MKKKIYISIIFGLILGIGQVFFVRTTPYVEGSRPVLIAKDAICEALIPECGWCPDELRKGDYCYEPSREVISDVSGWPLSVPGTVEIGNWRIMANALLFIVGIPLITYGVLYIRKKQLQVHR